MSGLSLRDREMSYLPPGPHPVSLLGAVAVRQLLDAVTDSETAAAGRQVLLFYLQPAERTHCKALRDRQTDRESDRQTDRQIDR